MSSSVSKWTLCHHQPTQHPVHVLGHKFAPSANAKAKAMRTPLCLLQTSADRTAQPVQEGVSEICAPSGAGFDCRGTLKNASVRDLQQARMLRGHALHVHKTWASDSDSSAESTSSSRSSIKFLCFEFLGLVELLSDTVCFVNLHHFLGIYAIFLGIYAVLGGSLHPLTQSGGWGFEKPVNPRKLQGGGDFARGEFRGENFAVKKGGEIFPLRNFGVAVHPEKTQG